MWVNAGTRISLFMSVCAYAFVCERVFVQSNPDYTHFSVSHFRRKEGEGRGRNRVREREGGREMFCHHGKHPSNEQQSQISDSPQASAALAGRRLKLNFGLETTESINSACKRITLLEWRTGSFIIYTLSSSLFLFPPSFFSLFLAVFSSCVFVCNRLLFVGLSCFERLVSGCWICKESQSMSQDGGTHVGFRLVLIYDAKSDSALYCGLLS